MRDRLRGWDPYVVALAVTAVALFVVLGAAMPRRFLDPDNFTSMAVQASELGMFSIAMTMALMIGGIDLSTVATGNLAAILAGLAIKSGAGSAWTALALGVLVALGVGVVAGLVNGLLIAAIEVPAILATLGTMTLFAGIAFGVTGGSAVFGLPDQLVDLANAAPWGVPTPFMLFVLVWLCADVLLRRTAFGEALILIGTNLRVARFSGIPTGRVIVGTYVASAVIAALAGFISLLRTNSAHPDYGGSYVLLSILVAVLGGVSVSGGAGRLVGVLWALVILQTLSTGLGMLLLYVPDGAFFRDFAWGLLLLVVMVVTARLKARRR